MITDYFSPDILSGQVAFITGGGSGINLAIVKSLASLGASIGICANSIVPGPINGTEGMKRMGGEDAKAIWQEMTPLGRMGQPHEVGDVVAFLATPLAGYISGARIAVDGGQNLTGSRVFNQAIGRSIGNPV